MSIGLYMDVHVPRAISFGLRLRGINVITSQEDSSTRLADPDLLNRATALGHVLFTQDIGFLRIAAERQQRQEHFAGIIYAHQADLTISQCVNDLEIMAKVYGPEDMANRVEYLPL